MTTSSSMPRRLLSSRWGTVSSTWKNHRATVPAPNAQDTLIEALRHLQDAGVRLDDIGLRRPSLDDVFLHLTDHHREPVPETIRGSR
jgi:hypothetical protein